MPNMKYMPAKIETLTYWSSTLRMDQIAALCGVHPEMIKHFVTLGLLEPADRYQGEWVFSRQAVSIVGKIIRLREQLGINYLGIGVVLDLLERIETLEEHIRELEKTRSEP